MLSSWGKMIDESMKHFAFAVHFSCGGTSYGGESFEIRSQSSLEEEEEGFFRSPPPPVQKTSGYNEV